MLYCVQLCSRFAYGLFDPVKCLFEKKANCKWQRADLSSTDHQNPTEVNRM